ncbi:hypothetical protein [Pseudomonas luteola]|uniref:RiboL-PSP-HEPN domain-containing protein n=1 Tax=Pseudomonas luteola TaxID=47886 RepID=A0ABS0MYL5_PSELU|nr:hypothetical protein [Pseudomonas luteola]MBH3441823.1 hypothetical protein [Pseudomonas luteola]
MQQFQTEARFTCPACQTPVVINVTVPEPDWGDAEEMSDLYSDDSAVITCNVCDTDFEAYITSTWHECSIQLNDHPDVYVDCDPAYFTPEDDDWLNDSVPESPFHIFRETFRQLHLMLEEHNSVENGYFPVENQFINRMIFAQAISAMEAYLGDSLIKYTLDRKQSLEGLINADDELKNKKFSLPQIIANDNLVGDAVKGYLKNTLYHNLSKVDFLYKAAAGIDIWGENSGKEFLNKAVSHRHDCVHRNGFTKDGDRLEIFTKAYLSETLLKVEQFVTHIESGFTSKLAEEALGQQNAPQALPAQEISAQPASLKTPS